MTEYDFDTSIKEINMLRFTSPTNLYDSNQEEQKKMTEDFQPLLDNFVNQLFKLPSLAILQLSSEQTDLSNAIKKMITQKMENAQKKQVTEQVASNATFNFSDGKYDSLIFSDNPKVTPEFQALIRKDSSDFLMRLFFGCKSESQLEFWIGNSYVELPKKPLALAIQLGCNIHVLQYLDKRGLLDNLTPEDEPEFTQRAKRFKNSPGFSYMENKFCMLKNTKTNAQPSVL
jgi:hypothetical protein